MKIEKSLRTLGDADLKGKKVFVRADLDVPLDNAQITDDTRIRASVPTIKFLIKKGAKVILASHLGCPKGVTPKFSLKPLVPRLFELLGVDVVMANDCIGAEVEKLAAALPEGGVLLLENVRFYKGEVNNDLKFAKKLASVADLYVNDAFGTPHWHHASTKGVTKFLSPIVAGFFLMQKPSEEVDKKILIEGALSRITDCKRNTSSIQQAILKLSTLTVDSEDCCEALVVASGVHILENLMHRSNEKVRNQVLYTLWNVAQFPHLLLVLAYDSLVNTLFTDLISEKSEASFTACGILKKLCESAGKHEIPEIPGPCQDITRLRTVVELRERHVKQERTRYRRTEFLEDKLRQLREIRALCQLIEELIVARG
uniref:Phosphoglycerate kinase n=1 Tax=Hordeum vulgare subsp. vulgare TaxID=112509 RepID=F2CWW4_HORVV|nr:predicted protein [Hordeum vulgare subsp. vulgare]